MNKKRFLLGYRAKGIDIYKQELKPVGKVIAGIGLASFGVALIPDVLLIAISPKIFAVGFLCYPLSLLCLGVVGINAFKIKKDIMSNISHKYTMFKYKRGLL